MITIYILSTLIALLLSALMLTTLHKLKRKMFPPFDWALFMAFCKFALGTYYTIESFREFKRSVQKAKEATEALGNAMK